MHSGLDDFLSSGGLATAKGPLALIFAEDAAEIDSTVRHHAERGFRAIVLFAPPGLPLPEELGTRATVVRYDTLADHATQRAVNAVMTAVPEGTWLYYCYNAEYLFHPFCESRTVGEMLAFHVEERRSAMLTYVLDLYAGDLARWPDAVSREAALLDRSGYYALARPDPAKRGTPRERQLDFFGGLRWRFEEHIQPARRRIDRIALFRARKGLTLRGDHTLSDEEMNTYACPWHNNLTAAICSFRTAKALASNLAIRNEIASFAWRNSVPFEWRSEQLLDLGLIEPGQWF